MSAPAAPVALVTGWMGGLGRAIVSRLLADGMRVVSADLWTDPAGVEKDLPRSRRRRHRR